MIRVSELIAPLTRVRGIYYGWWLAGLGALINALGPVPLFQGMPVWNPVLRARMGWTKEQLVWAFAMGRIEGGLLGPLEGILVDKLGPRRMVVIGMVILGGGFVLFSLIQELWQLYLVFVMMTLGAAVGTWLPMMTVINQWFIRHRSKAMSVVMEGFAVGGIVVPLAMAWAIGSTDLNEPERFGWRATALVIGLVIIALALPASRLVRNRPEDYGLLPDGDTPVSVAGPTGPHRSPQPGVEEQGYTWQEATRTRAFWLMSVGHACAATAVVTITVHLGLMLDERDFSLQTIGLVVSTYTGAGAVAILVGGYMGDRVPMRFTVFGFGVVQAVGVFVLVLAHSTTMVLLFALIFGVGFGGRNPPTTAIRGAYFGRRAFATITGIGMVPMNVMLLAVPVFAAYVNYNVSFLIVAFVSVFGSSLYLFLGEPNA